MNYSQEFLNKKLQAIRDCQNNPKYVPVVVADKRKASQEKIAARAEKQRLREENKAAKKLLDERKRADRETAKRAKEIAEARKIKRLQESFSPAKSVAYKPAPEREKPLPSRPLNLEGLVRVRVNSRTEVYVKPGYDLKKLKAKYNSTPLVKPDDHLPPKYEF